MSELISNEYKRALEKISPSEYQRMVMGEWTSFPTDFNVWLRRTYPDLHLLKWQQDVIDHIFSNGRGAGKTTLIRLLNEYEQTMKNEDRGDNA